MADGKVTLLSGGNPQIPKGDGDAPVQAFIAACPEWKRPLAERLDAILTAEVPGVVKKVRWNSPFYGVDEATWFASYHCFTRYMKVTFANGARLEPLPKGKSKHSDVRYYDVPEDGLDEALFAEWVRQAAKLPGEAF
ncbi:DUF1801 domain-containing protein [Pseudoroseicyclus tamaricis]|uniref:DUF1801 domain-containing protein n=1 Tax=Pseudoroseicyclus tamaricis TaxID=2705421 RepID=A0A6B2JVD4_9RHOB|nr:DUF1801 domain-containing protein [Pseudoroseicyclus tamaricis]NDV01855.1 DUF1801 domain-containing protein [Pseudoroseicyclus tamaricis]